MFRKTRATFPPIGPHDIDLRRNRDLRPFLPDVLDASPAEIRSSVRLRHCGSW